MSLQRGEEGRRAYPVDMQPNQARKIQGAEGAGGEGADNNHSFVRGQRGRMGRGDMAGIHRNDGIDRGSISRCRLGVMGSRFRNYRECCFRLWCCVFIFFPWCVAECFCFPRVPIDEIRIWGYRTQFYYEISFRK